jgi:ABC-type uncharacterized transport system involved in gliding motility auxiliary subunit
MDQNMKHRERGAALARAVNLVLLLLVLGQVVYLASRHRVRFDTTSDDLYSLTDSTRSIVEGLDRRLLVEAYFSPREDLSSQLRETRTVLDNFLDELVQLGRGRVVVQRYNPLEDKSIQDKCTRIGIKPIDAQNRSTNSLSVQRHWQGLRLLYGDQQKVIEQLGPQTSFLAEAILTPAIKEVATEEKRVIGFMEWPSDPAQGQQQGRGWQQIRQVPEIARRYEFRNVRDSEGALVPDDIETLMLFRPRDLTDRQKYVIDQFLLGGGTIVLFHDAADYGIAPRRQFNDLKVATDDKDSTFRFRDQLLHYGIDAQDQLVADLAREAMAPTNAFYGQEYYGLPSQMGFVQSLPQGYPYFFHAVGGDWAQVADQLAAGDSQLADRYRSMLRPGIDTEEFLFKPFKQMKRGPGFYWPAWTDLRRKGGAVDMPESVTGKVLLWSSPLAVVESPPSSTDPLGGSDAMARSNNYNQFMRRLIEAQRASTHQQAPLMVALEGRFPSWFAGKDRPLKVSEQKAQEAQRDEAEPGAGEGPAADEKPAELAAAEGPPLPDELQKAPDVAAPTPEPRLDAAAAAGRFIVIGDSDFLRDDLVAGTYQQLGGPVSFHGRLFFQLLCDWLSQDSDLVALHTRVPVDRKLDLVKESMDKAPDPRDAEKQLRRKTNALVWLNVVVPCALLLVLGGAVFVSRRAQKRSFLQSVDR